MTDDNIDDFSLRAGKEHAEKKHGGTVDLDLLRLVIKKIKEHLKNGHPFQDARQFAFTDPDIWYTRDNSKKYLYRSAAGKFFNIHSRSVQRAKKTRRTVKNAPQKKTASSSIVEIYEEKSGQRAFRI